MELASTSEISVSNRQLWWFEVATGAADEQWGYKEGDKKHSRMMCVSNKPDLQMLKPQSVCIFEAFVPLRQVNEHLRPLVAARAIESVPCFWDWLWCGGGSGGCSSSSGNRRDCTWTWQWILLPCLLIYLLPSFLPSSYFHTNSGEAIAHARKLSLSVCSFIPLHLWRAFRKWTLLPVWTRIAWPLWDSKFSNDA